MLKEMVARAAAGEDLDETQAADAMREMMAGEASPALVSAFLTALKMKGETADEVTGFARVMRDHSVRIRPDRPHLVDTCGTGGGEVSTFNISTAAAFVAAGAGAAVAKHGNRAVTSACGSADVLEALGVRIDLPAERVRECIEEVGIGFLFAPAHHPAMRHVGPVRRELPFRTVFNCLGPLTNPAGAPSQVIGVYQRELVPLLAAALEKLGCRRALVVYGVAGLDEISTLGATLVADVREGSTRCEEWTPESVGLPAARPQELAPGPDPAGNAALLRSVLAGAAGARRDIVLLNAAAALLAAGVAGDLAAGLARAAESIDSGAAMEKLEELRSLTRTGDS